MRSSYTDSMRRFSVALFSRKTRAVNWIFILPLILLAGCAADPERLKSVSINESARLQKPSKPLSEFSRHELKPFLLSAEIKGEADKVQEAATLEEKVREKLLPLFESWSKPEKPGANKTLIVEPELVRLRIVSGGARFWVGAFAGDSNIDLDLRLIDAETNNLIAKPRITLSAGAFVGGLSIGQSDQNLHDYIAHIVHRYFVDNYK